MECQSVQFTERGKVVVQIAPVETPGTGEVLIEAITSVISPGTELAFLHGAPNTPSTYPTGSGYCMCGRVAACGADVTDLRANEQVVALLPHTSAAIASAADCYHVPPGLAPADAAAFTMVMICLEAVRKSQVQLGDSVAILGLGIIGNIAGQLARAAGATHVAGIDPLDWRRPLATSSGFDQTAADLESTSMPQHPVRGDGFDVVIEATGLPAPINQAFQLARPLGRVVLLGSTRGTTDVNFYRDVHKKGLTVVGAHASCRPKHDDILQWRTQRSEILTSLQLLAAGRIAVGPLITDTMTASEAPRAYERLAARTEQLMTIALQWQ